MGKSITPGTFLRILSLAAVIGCGAASGQTGSAPKPPAASTSQSKKPVSGYTRTNKHTEQIRPHTRRSPEPKPVEVRPYTRGGNSVSGHERRRPSGPAATPKADKPTAQSRLIGRLRLNQG